MFVDFLTFYFAIVNLFFLYQPKVETVSITIPSVENFYRERVGERSTIDIS